MAGSVRASVAIDGVEVEPERAVVSVFDRGFAYGDGVFETWRTYGEVQLFLEAHLARLRWSCERALITPPLAPEPLLSELERLVPQMRASFDGDVSVRLVVTRGEGPTGLDPTGCDRPTRVLFVAPFVPPPDAVYRDGVDVLSSRVVRASDALGGAKALSYLPSVVALAEVRARGGYEPLVVSHDGFVLEGATSNVFAWLDGRLCTPPVEGILPGITRAAVLEAAQALGLPSEERRLSPPDLAASDEVFLTSSLRELVPVVRVDGFLIGEGRVGPMVRALHAAFRERAGLPPHPALGPR